MDVQSLPDSYDSLPDELNEAEILADAVVSLAGLFHFTDYDVARRTLRGAQKRGEPLESIGVLVRVPHIVRRPDIQNVLGLHDLPKIGSQVLQ